MEALGLVPDGLGKSVVGHGMASLHKLKTAEDCLCTKDTRTPDGLLWSATVSS